MRGSSPRRGEASTRLGLERAGAGRRTPSVSAIVASHLRISIALVEICVGAAAAAVADRLIGPGSLGADAEWLRFLAASGAVLLTILAVILLPPASHFITRRYGHRTAAIRTKWIVFNLFALGALALWAGSEPVLPAYVLGMVLAEFADADAHFMRRLRTLTVGFLTPFYFIRAGSLVSLPAVVTAPVVLALLLGAKVASKIFGLFPFISLFRRERDERWYYTLMMSTGLTFGTISALYGFSHGIVTRGQYSLLVAAVIASAVVPTMIASAAFMPHHLLPAPAAAADEEDAAEE